MSKHIVENDYVCIPNIMKLHILQAVASKYMNSLIILPLIQKFNRIGSQKKKKLKSKCNYLALSSSHQIVLFPKLIPFQQYIN